VNVTGTAHLLAAVAAAGSRLVHVSSTSVFGRQRYRSAPTDESAPLPDLPAADAYGRSKQEAERLVLDAHAGGRAWAVVVRPPVMYGRRDRQFAPRLGPVLERGVFPLIGGGRTRLTLVHADAVADGAIRAATNDAAGGRVYHLTNDFDVTVAEMVRFAARGLERRVLAPRLPVAVGRVAFRALARALVAAGRRDLAPHAEGLLQMLTRDNPFTSERARRELGWSPVIRPAEGLPEAFRWWKDSRGAGDLDHAATGRA
jgi:UDP-glucose 4-epimerase